MNVGQLRPVAAGRHEVECVARSIGVEELADAVLDGNGLLLKAGVSDHPISHEMPLLDGILSEKLPTVIGWFKDNHPVRYGWVGAADGCLGNAHFLDGLCEGKNRCLEVEFELIFGNFISFFHNRYRYEWKSRSGTARPCLNRIHCFHMYPSACSFFTNAAISFLFEKIDMS